MLHSKKYRYTSRRSKRPMPSSKADSLQPASKKSKILKTSSFDPEAFVEQLNENPSAFESNFKVISDESKGLSGFQAIEYDENIVITDRELNPELILDEEFPKNSDSINPLKNSKTLDETIIGSIHKEPLDDTEAESLESTFFDDSEEDVDLPSLTDHSQIESCSHCLSSPLFPSNLLISVGDYSILYLAPRNISYAPGTCIITTLSHTPNLVQSNQEEYEEILQFQFSLQKMLESNAKQKLKKPGFYIFSEGYLNSTHSHCHIFCVPISFEKTLDASGYFRKALEDQERDSDIHKKFYLTSKPPELHLQPRQQGNIQVILPKQLSYFHVEFGLGGGFARIIESDWNPTIFVQDIYQALFGHVTIGSLFHGSHGKDLSTITEQEKQENDSDRFSKFIQMYHPFGHGQIQKS